MQLVNQTIISKNHKDFAECDKLCFAAKNLYNYALYQVKNHYELTNKYLNYNAVNKILVSENQIDYRRLPAKVSQQVLMLLDKNYKSYFAALKAYNQDPSSFLGEPQPPKFKAKLKGRFVVTYTKQAISYKQFKQGIVNPSGTSLFIKTDFKDIDQLRIVPKNNQYVLEIIYKKEASKPIQSNNYAGIDIGVNNLATIVYTDCESSIINGKPLKSINQYYNKKLAKLKSELPLYIDKRDGKRKQRKKSNATVKLTNKRNNKIKDYLHKASRILVDKLQQKQISKVVIGKNDNWKQNSKLSRKTNSNFVAIPHARFIDMLTYKCKLVGIEIITREESYTSKCSFLDNEPIKKHKTYKGKRIKRGLFRSEKGLLINSDVQGAANILKKEVPKAFNNGNGIEGILVYPIILKVKF